MQVSIWIKFEGQGHRSELKVTVTGETCCKSRQLDLESMAFQLIIDFVHADQRLFVDISQIKSIIYVCGRHDLV